MTWKAYYCKFRGPKHLSWIVQEQVAEKTERSAAEAIAIQRCTEVINQGGAFTSGVKASTKSSYIGTTNGADSIVFAYWVTQDSWYVGQEVEKLETLVALKEKSKQVKI